MLGYASSVDDTSDDDISGVPVRPTE